MSRWATFDCYGTLIDWNAGIRGGIEQLWGVDRSDELLALYHELEPQVEEEPYRSYAEVLTLTLERVAQETGLGIPEGESDVLPRTLPEWPPFPEVPAALEELRRRGWQLAALSNTDRDLLAASERRLGISFDVIVTAEDVGSYKPAKGHWERFFEVTTADRERHVHVAQSHFHDVVPATGLGLRTVWINRLGEEGEPRPTAELPDLERLPDTLDALVPAA
jgi:2-haloacid dehalogenase